MTVTVPSLANQVVGTFYSGSPYLGKSEALPPGVQTLNQCGEYYIISHNHALYQITSWGAVMTGPITYMRIEPPEPEHLRLREAAMTMKAHLRTAALSIAAGGGLTLLGLFFGAGSASADPVGDRPRRHDGHHRAARTGPPPCRCRATASAVPR